MMKHYDIRENSKPNDGSFIKYTAKVEWDDNIKSILEFVPITDKKGKLLYDEYTKAECGCCGVNYAYLPSDLNSIIERGYCSWCILYKEGKFDYINSYRPLTYEEISIKLTKPDSKFSTYEVNLLLKEQQERILSKKNGFGHDTATKI